MEDNITDQKIPVLEGVYLVIPYFLSTLQHRTVYVTPPKYAHVGIYFVCFSMRTVLDQLVDSDLKA